MEAQNNILGTQRQSIEGIKGIMASVDKAMDTVNAVTTSVGEAVNPTGTKNEQLRTGAVIGMVAAGAIAGLFLGIFLTTFDQPQADAKVKEEKKAL